MMNKPEPVAKLFQHGETGRPMIREMDRPDSALSAQWSLVGYLYPESALAQAREQALREAAQLCDDLRIAWAKKYGGELAFDGGYLSAYYKAADEIRARINQPRPVATGGNPTGAPEPVTGTDATEPPT